MSKWKENEIKFLIDKYSMNGAEYCSKELSKTIDSIRSKVSKLKLKIDINKRKEIYSKSNSEKWKHYDKPLNEYNINLNLFLDIKIPEIVYLLGFMWGDGYIYSLGKGKINKITICNNLSSDVDEIKNIFLKTGQWNIYNHKRKNKKDMTEISTNNLPLCNFLIENDFKMKSYYSPDKILNKIPNNLLHYFYLGLSDADGCFYYNKTCYQYIITSTLEQNWLFMENLCEKLNIKYNIIKIDNKNSYSQFRIINKKDIIKIGKFLYKNYHDDKIGLNRKYNKYLDIFKKEKIKINYETLVCPHCGKSGKGPNMQRYHFDNCKIKK